MEITLGQVWMKAFNFFGSFLLMDLVWIANILLGLSFAMIYKRGFWKWFGIFALTHGSIQILLRVWGLLN